MTRRTLLGLLAGASALALPSPVVADVTSSCGGSATVVTTASTSSANFRIDYAAFGVPPESIGGDLAITDYVNALEAAYAKQVTQYGWWAPPDLGGDKYHVLVAGDPPGGGEASPDGTDTGPASPNPLGTDDGRAACLWLDNDMSAVGPGGTRALNGVVARELNRMILLGVGALTDPVPDPVFALGGPVAMIEETFPDSDLATADLWPKFEDSLGAYDDAEPQNQWLALRGLSERFGAGEAGGAEQVLQDFWERMARRTEVDLAALDDALANHPKGGVSLGQAFHDYAIAARAMQPCGQASLPYCFADAAAYVAAAGARADHNAVTSVPGQAGGMIEDDYAIQWIGLPAGPSDVTATNSAGAGVMQATAVCTTLRIPFPSTLGAGQGATVRAFPPAGCDNPAVVLTTASRTAPNPAQSTARAYTITTAAPTATITVALAGTGLGTVGSIPDGLLCGTACSAAFPLGSRVSLVAAAAKDSIFTGWSGSCSGAATTCVVTADASKTVTATFAKLPGQPASITGDKTGPKVRLDKLALARNRRALRIRVTCPRIEVNRCSGFVAMRARAAGKKLKFGEQAFLRLAGGRRATLTFPLTRRLRGVMRRVRRLKVKVTARARDDAFNYTTTRRTLRLRVGR